MSIDLNNLIPYAYYLLKTNSVEETLSILHHLCYKCNRHFSIIHWYPILKALKEKCK